MKVLVSNAVWGEAYCSTFTRLSLASLLSPNNLPRLSKQATITFHIVTTSGDRRRLLRDSVIIRLMSNWAVEWEILEDFGIYRPPTGAGGEKYPFLSALQNLAITRSLDQDAVVFNYADFIWADGSLTAAVEMLLGRNRFYDAVLGFCLPVDRDAGAPALQRYRQLDDSGVIDISPRNAAKLVIEHMHREAKNRFWDAPGFTNLPTYMAWKIADQGVLLRAYHQSILAMRVRTDDPQYREGITRGSLDACLTAQLAEHNLVVCANDTEKVLVFSLYDTPVDSRLPPGETREMSLRNMLRADVIPEQRRFSEYPFLLKLRDGDESLWQRGVQESWGLLHQAHAETTFDQTLYDANYATHGLIPKLLRKSLWRRWASLILGTANRWGGKFSQFIDLPLLRGALFGKVFDVLRNPSHMRHSRRLRGFWAFVDRSSSLLFMSAKPKALRPIIEKWIWQSPPFVRRLWFIVRFPAIFLRTFTQTLARAWAHGDGYELVPNLWVNIQASRRLSEAMTVEDSASWARDDSQFVAALNKAEVLLNETILQVPVWTTPRRALGRNLWFQGRFEEAIQALDAAEKIRDVMAWIAGFPSNACVFLPRNCAESIGLMGHLDAFVKHRILTEDSRPYYLLAPVKNVINPAFLSYWCDYIKIVSAPDEIESLEPMERIYGADWNWAMPQDGKTIFVHQAMAAIQRAWQTAGRPPLLQLSAAHADQLSRTRRKWGMRDGDRYVCLHVRSAGFYGESREHAQRFRNTSVNDYYPLVRMLADMGFWVIRMGDSTMQPLDLAECGASGRVIDYALSNDKAAELDVALCAQCELFVSSPSGLHTVAHAFGRPVCEVNYPIYAGFPWHPDDIFVPQFYYSRLKDRVLTLREILGSDIIHLDHHFLLERAGITLLSLEPDDIVEAVREALSPSTYHVSDAGLAARVYREFDELNQQFKLGISGRLGRYYSAKYAAKLLLE